MTLKNIPIAIVGLDLLLQNHYHMRHDWKKHTREVARDFSRKINRDFIRSIMKKMRVQKYKDIHVGDTLEIEDHINHTLEKYIVIGEDGHSFSVCSTGWWWYRESLEPYVGDATIISHTKKGK